MKQFFELSLETKKLWSYQAENNLGYSIMGAENVDPNCSQRYERKF